MTTVPKTTTAAVTWTTVMISEDWFLTVSAIAIRPCARIARAAVVGTVNTIPLQRVPMCRRRRLDGLETRDVGDKLTPIIVVINSFSLLPVPFFRRNRHYNYAWLAPLSYSLTVFFPTVQITVYGLRKRSGRFVRRFGRRSRVLITLVSVSLSTRQRRTRDLCTNRIHGRPKRGSHDFSIYS